MKSEILHKININVAILWKSGTNRNTNLNRPSTARPHEAWVLLLTPLQHFTRSQSWRAMAFKAGAWNEVFCPAGQKHDTALLRAIIFPRRTQKCFSWCRIKNVSYAPGSDEKTWNKIMFDLDITITWMLQQALKGVCWMQALLNRPIAGRCAGCKMQRTYLFETNQKSYEQV